MGGYREMLVKSVEGGWGGEVSLAGVDVSSDNSTVCSFDGD